MTDQVYVTYIATHIDGIAGAKSPRNLSLLVVHYATSVVPLGTPTLNPPLTDVPYIRFILTVRRMVLYVCCELREESGRLEYRSGPFHAMPIVQITSSFYPTLAIQDVITRTELPSFAIPTFGADIHTH